MKHVSLPYEDLVNIHHTALVVRDLSIRYRKPALLGDEITVSVKLVSSPSMIRIAIESEIVRERDSVLLATAVVTIAPINTKTGTVRREWPDVLTRALGSVLETARMNGEQLAS